MERRGIGPAKHLIGLSVTALWSGAVLRKRLAFIESSESVYRYLPRISFAYNQWYRPKSTRSGSTKSST